MQSKSNAQGEVATYFGLVLGLSYFVFWGPLVLFRVPTISFASNTFGPAGAIALFIAGGFVPSLVAIILTLKREGPAGLRQLGRRVLQFAIGWRWYLRVLGIVALTTAGQILLAQLLGHIFDLSLFATQLGSSIPLLVLGPLSEELGWRGYALDRLQTRWNALVSSLIVGVMWALWHLPLFFMVGTSQKEWGIPFMGFAMGVTALSVLFTWLHNNTGGSVWAAIFFHWVYTYAAGVVASGVPRSPLYNWLEYLPYVAAAAVVTAAWGPGTLRRKQPRRSAEAPPEVPRPA